MSKYFDIPGRTFDFSADLTYGESGEELVRQFLASLSGGDFEVKSDRYRNGKMVVETDQNPKGIKDEQGNPIWVRSGINVTTAKWWVYIYSPEGAFVVISVERLKRYLRAHPDKFKQTTKIALGGADNPAKGFLLMPEQVMEMLYSKEYDNKENK